MGNTKRCPECGNTTELSMERSPWGKSYCGNCNFNGPHALFYTQDNNSEKLFIQDKYDKNKYIDAKGDYVIAQGGDGTMLTAINKFRHLNKPFFGIGAGTLNFLMNKPNSNSEYNIFKNAKYKTFNLIKVKVAYEKPNILGNLEENIEIFQAFNDVMLGGDMNSWIDFNVHDKDKIIGQFKGGGLIISTAQGSTGINKNNNGVILPLGSKNWSVTGDKTNRKINYVIKPKRTTITCESRTSVRLWVDGHNHIIDGVIKIEISKGDKVTLIFNNYDDFKRKRRQ